MTRNALALVSFAIVCACPSSPNARTCNTDLDCLNTEICANGTCSAGPTDAGTHVGEGEGVAGEGEGAEGEGVAGEGEGASSEGEGSSSEGEGEGIVGEGEGEGTIGEGEGEGEGAACAIDVDERFEAHALSSSLGTPTPAAFEVIDGALRIDASLSGSGAASDVVGTTNAFDLTGRDATVRLLALPPANASLFLVAATTGPLFDGFNVFNDHVDAASTTSASTTLGFDPTQRPFLRLHDDGASLLLESSSDGVAYEIEGALPAQPYMTSAQIDVGVVFHAVNTSIDGLFFDDLRVSSGACDRFCVPALETDFRDAAIDPPLDIYTFGAGGVSLVPSTGAVTIHLPAGNGVFTGGGVSLDPPRDLRGLRMTASARAVPAGANAYAYVAAGPDGTHNVSAVLYSNFLILHVVDEPVRNDSPTVAYDPVATPFVRVTYRVSPDEAVLETSPDGLTFTEVASVPTLPPFMTSASLGFGAETDVDDPATSATFERLVVDTDGCPP